jgi:glycosyltransferase involved in cell wall biosynthesis
VNRIAHAKCSGFATYLGDLPVRKLIALFDSASALIHVPSEEAFGLVVAEALSRNLKLFATNVGGVPEIADDVEAVELFELEDRQGLLQGIAKWLDVGSPCPKSPAHTMRLRYHPQTIAEKHVAIYHELLAT